MSEPPGFRDYVVARQGVLLRSAWMLCGDWQAAEDLVQTALVKVWPSWEKLARDGNPEAYIRRTIVNTFISSRRRRWRGEQPTAVLPEHPGPTDAYALADLRDSLARLLPTLPPKQRAVLVLRFYEDLSEQQTADLLGCSLGTVKSTTSRALGKLRRSLAPVGPQGDGS